jgi:hypothetical protein
MPSPFLRDRDPLRSRFASETNIPVMNPKPGRGALVPGVAARTRQKARFR